MSLRSKQGNTLALLLAVSLTLLLAVAFLVINYNQLLGGQKQVASAVDAAALAAARDMGRIVVDCQLGRIALVDDGPGSNGYPVQSVNSVMGNLRLTAIIATRLNNTTLQWLAAQDLDRLNSALDVLKQKIELARTGAGGAYDKNGNAVLIGGTSGSAYLAYKGNSRRLLSNGKTATGEPASFEVKFGTVKKAISSQVPIPNPTTSDTISYGATNTYTDGSNRKYYLSNTNFDIMGLAATKQVRFVAVSQGQTALIETSNFTDQLATNDVPSLAQVTVKENTKQVAGGKTLNQLELKGTAQAGGSITSLLSPSGALVVSFAGPIPPNPPASGSNPLKFDTVQHIINASQFGASDTKPASSYNGWRSDDNKTSTGTWNSPTGGNIPGGGSLPAPPGNTPFKGIAGRESDDPSIALTCLVYDWLRSLGTRPNLNSVYSALTFDLSTFSGTTKQFTERLNDGWMPPAYAADQAAPETTGVFRLEGNGDDDPRNLRFWSEHVEEYNRQQARMWGYLPGEGVMPADTKMVQLDSNGAVTTMDGHPVQDLNDILDQINYSNIWANVTYANAYEIAIERAKEAAKTDSQIQQLMTQDPNAVRERIMARADQILGEVFKKDSRLESVYANSQYIARAAASMKKNLKALSSQGASRVSGMHFRLMANSFYPISSPATKQMILGEGRCPTGQDPSLGQKADWCCPLKADKSPQLPFFEEAQKLVIPPPVSATPSSMYSGWLPPALAQSSNPSNSDNKFIFCIYDKDASALGSFRVMVTKATTSPFANVPCYKGQAHYQNVKAVVLKATNDPNQKVEWQVQAKDEMANAYPVQTANAQPNQSAAATYFNTQDKDGAYCNAASGAKCPGLIAEWALTCPLVQSPPPAPPPPPPVVTPPAPPPPCTRMPADGSGIYAGSNPIMGNWGYYDSRGAYVHGAWTGTFASVGYAWPWGYYVDTKGYNTAVGGPYFVTPTLLYYYYTCDPRPIYYAT